MASPIDSSLNYMENYDLLYPDQPVVDLYLPIWASHSAFVNKPAFRWVDMSGNETHSLSYGLLNRAADIIARELLHDFGLSHGDRVIAVYPPGLEFVELLFGSQRAGLVLVPISSPDPSSFTKNAHEKLIRQINEISPKLILAPAETRLAFQGLVHKYKVAAGNGEELFVLPCPVASLKASLVCDYASYGLNELVQGTSSHGEKSRAGNGKYTGCKPHDTYLIQYTSGATGPPKAALITAGAAAHNVRAVRRKYEFQPSSVIASWLPAYHDGGLMLALSTVVSGATMVLSSPFSFVQRPILWIQMISEFGATSTTVPAFALPLTSQKFELAKRSGAITWRMDLSQLKNVMVMNEPITTKLIDDFVKKFEEYGLQRKAMAPSYGLAEMCTFVTSSWDGGFAEALPMPTCGNLVASGKLQPEFDIRIVDPETRTESRNGEEGEIWIASASKAAGYLGDLSLTSRSLHATIAARQPSERKFLRTGDMGRIINEYLFVTGRVADVMFLNGRVWHPHNLEVTAFESSPDLRPGCAVAFSLIPGMARRNNSSAQENDLVILVELNGKTTDYGHQQLADTIHLALQLNHGISASVVGVLRPRSIPKTTSGKLQRQESRQRFVAGQFQFVECRSYVASSASEHNVANRLEQSLQMVLKSAITATPFPMFKSRILAQL